jgi:hypothetical protein
MQVWATAMFQKFLITIVNLKSNKAAVDRAESVPA